MRSDPQSRHRVIPEVDSTRALRVALCHFLLQLQKRRRCPSPAQLWRRCNPLRGWDSRSVGRGTLPQPKAGWSSRQTGLEVRCPEPHRSMLRTPIPFPAFHEMFCAGNGGARFWLLYPPKAEWSCLAPKQDAMFRAAECQVHVVAPNGAGNGGPEKHSGERHSQKSWLAQFVFIDFFPVYEFLAQMSA